MRTQKNFNLRFAAGAIGLALLAAGCNRDTSPEQSAAMNASTANVEHITDGQFEAEVTQSQQPVIAEIYATWCGPCRKLAPLMEQIAGAFSSKIKFVKINLDESPQTVNRFNIEGVPTLLFFKDGKVVETLIGLRTAEELRKRVTEFSQSSDTSAAGK